MTVKSTHTFQDKLLLNIESEDVHTIPYNVAVNDQLIWKILMYGQPRDYELIQKLSKNTSLKKMLEVSYSVHGEGFQEGKNNQNPTDLLYDRPYLKAGGLKRFSINEDDLIKCKVKKAVRDRSSIKEIYKGPHLLVDQHPKEGKGIISAILENDAVFTDSYIGIYDEDIDFLSTLCSILNSDLALYYLFITSRQWKVDRGHLQKDEVMSLPLPENIKKYKISFKQLKNFENNLELWNINQSKILDMYDLTWSEKILIEDRVNMIYNYYWEREKSNYDKKLRDSSPLVDYGNIFCKIINQSFAYEKEFKPYIFFNKNSPLLLINFVLIKDDLVPSIFYEDDLQKELKHLDDALISNNNTSIYITQRVKRYFKNGVTIIKPNKLRYWIKSNALHDADKVYSDIMSVGI